MKSATPSLSFAATIAAAALLCCAVELHAQEPSPPAAAPRATEPTGVPASGPSGTSPAAGTSTALGTSDDKSPTPEQIATALQDLAGAARIAALDERADVVTRNAGVADAKVIKALAKFLKDKERPVRLAAIEALAITPHADAVKELQRLLPPDSRLSADAALLAALLRAIGRHGDPPSLKVLAADAWKFPDSEVVRARLYAIGNIRSKASVEQLMDLMNTDPTLPWENSPYMGGFRVALAHLTGADENEDKDKWRDWFRANGKSLKVTAEAPRLPPDLQRSWDDFWKLPVPATRAPAGKSE